MTENRKIAMCIALGNFLADELEPEEYEAMGLDEFRETVNVWQPFEYMDSEDVCAYIEGLADDIEQALNKKDDERDNAIEDYIQEVL